MSGCGLAETEGPVKIAFVTTCKNRSFHIAETLPKNMAANPRSTFVVLDYGSEDDLQDVLKPLASDRLAVYQYQKNVGFHMTHAKNMAHRLGTLEGADVLVNVDADNYLAEGFEDFVESVFEDRDVFLWSGIIQGLGGKFRGCGGRIAVTPAAFIKAGGYDESFTTWSHDDKDFNTRIQSLGYRPVATERRYLGCIPHGDGLRFKEYPHARQSEHGEYAGMERPQTTVVNGGNFGCGLVRRLDGTQVDLKPVPTRIFGVGMHKTATNSLHAALTQLGYDSAHWPSGIWARDVYNEMMEQGRSATLERSYAACDLPITILYKELDRAYPGSKFILTVRDEEKWLASARKHWSHEHNPYRWEWDVYPVNNKIHKLVYGRTDFDARVMMERYVRHNREVLHHFRGRPGDLLVMDMDGGAGWKELCGFLGKAVPQSEYPREFVTKGD